MVRVNVTAKFVVARFHRIERNAVSKEGADSVKLFCRNVLAPTATVNIKFYVTVE